MAPVTPQDLSLAYRAYLYKVSYEGLHNVYSVGGFVLMCVFAALLLMVLCNYVADVSCRRAPEQEKFSKAAPPKQSQTVYSSLLPPREDFVVNMDMWKNTVHTQTPGQVVIEMPEPQRKVRKKAIKIRAGQIRRLLQAKKRKAKHPFKPAS